MRALVLRGADIGIADVEEPVPDEGQVLVRPLAAGICGSDLHLVDAARRAGGATNAGLPDGVVLGHEFCCEVLETTGEFTAGTRVCAVPVSDARGVATLGTSPVRPGAYAERMVLNTSLLLRVPDDLATEIAALTEPMAVGWHAVQTARPGTDDVPLVIGCGPVGLSVIAGLKVKGVGPIVAADFSPTRRALAQAMGADVVIDPAEHSPYTAWQEALTPSGVVNDPAAQSMGHALLGLTPRLRPGVVFECVGVPGVIAQIMAGAVRGTRIVVVGVCMGPDEIRPLTGITKDLSVSFSMAYSQEEFAQTLRHLADGRIDAAPLVTGRVGLDGAPQAFDDLRDPERHAKILVEPWR